MGGDEAVTILFAKPKTTHGASATLVLCLLSPVAGKKQPARIDDLERATSVFLLQDASGR